MVGFDLPDPIGEGLEPIADTLIMKAGRTPARGVVRVESGDPQRFGSFGSELVIRQPLAANPKDDRTMPEVFPVLQFVEGRDEFAFGQVASRSEDDEDVRFGGGINQAGDRRIWARSYEGRPLVLDGSQQSFEGIDERLHAVTLQLVGDGIEIDPDGRELAEDRIGLIDFGNQCHLGG